MRTHWIIVVLALTGCAGKLEELVREQAAKDLNCPISEVDVYDQRSDNYVRDYTVSGCGQSAHYQAACSMVESCVAYQPAKIGKDAAASEALTAGIDAIPGSESVEEVVVAADGTVTVNRSGPAAAPPPTKTPLELAQEAEAAQTDEPLLSLTLRNTCSETVTLWFGPTPNSLHGPPGLNGGGGHMMTLASTNMATVRVRSGEQLWVLDREHNGTAGVAVDASMHEVDVGCAGLTAR